MKNIVRPLPLPRILLTAAIALGAQGATPACGGGEEEDDDDTLAPRCTEPVAEVECRDATLVDLEMNPDQVSPGLIDNSDQGGFFHTTVDATAGGFGGDGAYVYAKFTKDGLVKVDITDDDSFERMDWDIAFRRFVIRLNSGMGGPSCVTAGRTGVNTDFEALAAVPDGMTFSEEQFMTPGTCDVISDGSGLPNAPGVVLQSYWEYANCLQMTGNVYVLQLADGHDVKFVVTHYYAEAAQQDCNETGANDASGSAHLQFNWAFLN